MDRIILFLVTLAVIVLSAQGDFDCTGKKNYFYQDDISCVRYYECRAQETINHQCGRGYFFSQQMVGCVSALMLVQDGTCTMDAYRAGMAPPGPFVCPRAGMFADRYNCSLYNYCVRASADPRVMSCPEQFFFNETLGSCSWRGNFKTCLTDGTPYTPTPPTTTTPKPTKYNPWATTTVIPTTPAPPTTTGRPCNDEGAKIVDEDDCRHFFICTNLFWVRYKCSPHLVYNVKTGVCQWDVWVDTCDGTKVVVPTTTIPTTAAPTTTTLEAKTTKEANKKTTKVSLGSKTDKVVAVTTGSMSTSNLGTDTPGTTGTPGTTRMINLKSAGISIDIVFYNVCLILGVCLTTVLAI